MSKCTIFSLKRHLMVCDILTCDISHYTQDYHDPASYLATMCPWVIKIIVCSPHNLPLNGLEIKNTENWIGRTKTFRLKIFRIVKNIKFLETTTNIPMKKNVRFGFRYRIIGSPEKKKFEAWIFLFLLNQGNIVPTG